MMQQLCRLPSFEVRFRGEPAVIAADLDEIFTELSLCLKGIPISRRAATAATDLLHRRVVLPYLFQFSLKESLVRIRTDSPLMSKACRKPGSATRPCRRSGECRMGDCG